MCVLTKLLRVLERQFCFVFNEFAESWKKVIHDPWLAKKPLRKMLMKTSQKVGVTFGFWWFELVGKFRSMCNSIILILNMRLLRIECQWNTSLKWRTVSNCNIKKLELGQVLWLNAKKSSWRNHLPVVFRNETVIWVRNLSFWTSTNSFLREQFIVPVRSISSKI